MRLKELRKKKKLNQKELASELGISQGTLSGWENKHYDPSVERLIQLADYFNVTIDYLVGRSDEIK